MLGHKPNHILKKLFLTKADSPSLSLSPAIASKSHITQGLRRGREQFRTTVRHMYARSNLSQDFKDTAHLRNDDAEENYRSPQMVQNSVAYTGYEEILIQLRNHVPNLLSSFCIISLQFPGHPVQVASKDLFLRDDIAEGQAYYLPDEVMEQPWVVRQELLDDGFFHLLTVQGELFERNNVGCKATHQFFGQLDLTSLVWDLTGGSSPLLADIRPRGSNHAKPIFPENVFVGAIKLLHSHYFIVKPSESGYDISHLAPDLIESIGPEYQDLPSTAFLDLESLSESFERGENFCAKVLWKLSKVYERLYCIPNFCPDLDCWLCFLVDGSYQCLRTPNG